VSVPSRRILFVINSIGYGGAEPSLFKLLDHLHQARNGDIELHLALLDDLPEARAVPDFVTKHVLGSAGSLPKGLIALTRLLRRLQPQLAVSFLVRANVCTALAARWRGCPSVICERMHLSSHLAENHNGVRRGAARLLPRLAYPMASAVVGVSTGVTRDLGARFGVPPSKASTIFNSYDLAALQRDAREPPAIPLPDRFFVAAGRLVRNKNFTQLLEAYAQVEGAPPLVILGEGEQRPLLEGCIARLGLVDRVRLPGYVANPVSVFARAEAYVASSLNEGFPNAMLEAMVVGKPVAVTNCPSGPAEILSGDPDRIVSGAAEVEYGVLIEPGSVAALAEAMRMLLQPALRDRYAVQSAKRAAHFSTAEVMPAYAALFDRLIAERRPVRTAGRVEAGV
jgi:glycosyltransferase involved in cell wall biosynthesis